MWGAILSVGAGLLGSKLGADAQSDAAGEAADAHLAATREQIDYARQSRDLSLQLTDPYRQAGYAAQAAMMDMLGLPRPQAGGAPSNAFSSYDPNVPLDEVNWQYDPQTQGGEALAERFVYGFGRHPDQTGIGRTGLTGPEGGALPPGVTAPDLGAYPKYDFKADPGYDFRFNEGVRAMDASASARGGLLDGGYGRALTRYGQDMASQEYMNVYNRLATLAGYGQTATQQGVSATMNAGNIMAGAAGSAGVTRASAYTAKGNAEAGFWGDVGSAVGAIDWSRLFNKKAPLSHDSGGYGRSAYEWFS